MLRGRKGEMENKEFQKRILDLIESLIYSIEEVNENIPVEDSDWTTPSKESVTKSASEDLEAIRNDL